MYYTASSVKKALRKNNDLEVRGLDDLMCPQKEKRTWDCWNNETECCRNFKLCPYARNRDCKQTINIYLKKNNKPLLRILNFQFTISETNNDGLIEKKDQALMQLIEKEMIDAEMLQSA